MTQTPPIWSEQVEAVKSLEAACNQARLALAGMVSVQSALDMLDCRPIGVSAALAASPAPQPVEEQEPADTLPKLANTGRYLAEDNTGQWHYINHAGTWQGCPPPFPPSAGEPDFYAIHSPTRAHIGLWPKKEDAYQVAEEYEGCTITPLYALSPNLALEAKIEAAAAHLETALLSADPYSHIRAARAALVKP